MSEREYRKKLAEEVTSEVLTDKFIQDIGQKAIVERTDAQGELLDILRREVAEIGEAMSKHGVAPKGMKYEGSLTVHIYTSEILNQAAFVSLNNMSKLHYALADAACREMNQKVKEYWGLRRQKLRSKF